MNEFGFNDSFKTFTDAKNFPRGFRKSGDFSIAESDILSNLGATLLALASGQQAPMTEMEKRFVDVVQGKLEAENKVEKTWMKYLKLTNTPRRFYTLNSSTHTSRKVESSEELDENDTMDFELDE